MRSVLRGVYAVYRDLAVEASFPSGRAACLTI